jgi:hypothetical protein
MGIALMMVLFHDTTAARLTDGYCGGADTS